MTAHPITCRTCGELLAPVDYRPMPTCTRTVYYHLASATTTCPKEGE